ncbi:MAG: uroporphyrinogen-III synthase [Flavobacteriaceae bacterium]|nr:uroporphyrinogen-III synthase [Flavobacteriaceae bacterium]
MIQILSTKKLNKKTRLAFGENGIHAIEAPMIKTALIDFQWPKIEDGIIITSSTALKSILKHKQFRTIINLPFFCVGPITKNKLIKLGLKVVLCENSAKELSYKLVEHYSDKAFNYFCGKQRLDIIENLMITNNISISFSEVYETKEKSKKVEDNFEGVLFFSPSAVKSFALNNSFNSKKYFSWGNTTANEIAKHTNNYFISKKPEIKSLILLIKKHIKKTDA